MSSFCGAWARDGASLERRLTPTIRAAMECRLERLSRTPDRFAAGPLWLAALPGLISGGGAACSAAEGVLDWTPDSDQGAALLRQRGSAAPCLRPAGHHALAYADAGRLILMRDPSGGERLYYAEVDGLVLFANALKPLLAHPGVDRRLDIRGAAQWLVHGAVQLGEGTLLAGVREVAAGETVVFCGESRVARRYWPDTAAPQDGAPPTPASLRRVLADAVRLAVGRDEHVAVALSGGIDSSAVAALAVELLGPKNVTALTYDFDHPGHPSEVETAARTCRLLGIAHQTLRFTYEDFRGAAPEAVWRMEEGFLGRSLSLSFAREAGRRGFTKTLTGQGMEALLGQVREEPLEAMARLLPSLPRPELLLRHWKLSFFTRGRSRTVLRTLSGLLHAGFKPPLPARYFVVLAVLRHNGVLRDAASLYPAALRDLLESSLESDHVRQAVAALRHLPLAVQLHHAVRHWDRTYFLRGRAALTRCAGSRFLIPAALTPAEWSARHLWKRPADGRALLARALRGDLPEEVLTRPKLWATREPSAWDRRLAADVAPLAAASTAALAAFFPGGTAASARFFSPAPGLRSWESVDGPYGFLNPVSLALWHRLFVESSVTAAPPTWDELAAQRP